MKCPYRKKVIHFNEGRYKGGIHDDEEFMECHGEECPHYHTSKYPNGDVINECRKAESEYYHATHLGGRQ